MWSNTVGLVNGQFKYLTAETFGHKINANGIGLKKKQLWSIEPFPISTEQSNGSSSTLKTSSDDNIDELECVAIKSHLNCYLSVDSYGNVLCDSSELSDGCRFIITICSMSSSSTNNEQICWAFRNVKRGYYLGCDPQGMIECNSKMPQTKAQLWNIHLLPAIGSTMFLLKSIARKRYGRSNENGQIQIDSLNGWGQETLFQFKYYDNGLYSLLSFDAKYLTSDGCLIDINDQNSSPSRDCLFTMEYHSGFVAFRDFSGRYLAAAGRTSALRTRSTTVSRDELFEFERAPIQLALRATFNNRFVSIKQGVDVSANQREITWKFETFQFEFDDKLHCWTISTQDGAYWSLGPSATIQVEQQSSINHRKGYFVMKWNEDGSCCLLTGDGDTIKTNDEQKLKWICARKSGQLYVTNALNDDVNPVKFYIKLRNRKYLNLRAKNTFGFVGIKGGQMNKLESNKTITDPLQIQYSNSDFNTNNNHNNNNNNNNNSSNGNVKDDDDESQEQFNCCYLKMRSNNKYLSIIDNNVAADATSIACAQQWQIELRTDIYVAIRACDSTSYLNLTNNGAIQVNNCGPNNATLWEF